MIIGSISGLALARLALDKAWGAAEVRRIGMPVVCSAIVSAVAIGLVAFLWQRSWVLWLLIVPASLSWFAWMVLALERSFPRLDPPERAES